MSHAVPPDHAGAGVLTEERAEDLLSLLAHDLRTPLNSILLGSELLAGRVAADDDNAAASISLIRHSVAHINGMVEDMLALGTARKDADGALSPATQVAPVMQDVVRDHRPLAELNGIRLELSLPAVDCRVGVHRASLRRVLSNLMSNAIRFTAAAGVVRLSAAAAGAEIQFVVADSGVGIPEDELPHVFDWRWHQQRDADTRAGLGLSLVKDIVEAHGGRISVRSRVGQGSTFIIHLPTVS